MENHDRRNDYHVFLSFRGADTRTNFTDHLYKALKLAHIKTFVDEDGLERGEALNPQLEDAIQRSDISIIIFSPEYASSEWCLDELVMILDRVKNFQHMIIPVFYKVDPSHIRYQIGTFGEGFRRHHARADKCMDENSKIEKHEKIQVWKTALIEAANLSGEHLTYEHETKFIEKIVGDVEGKLLQERKHVIVAKDHLVGIDKQARSVVAWLQNSTTNDILTLLGMGGIGKTTIADYVYKSNIEHFEDGCFLGNIREISERHGSVEVLSQFLSRINRRKSQTWRYPDDIKEINQYLSSRRVLIVLDDVDKVKQLEDLQLQHLKFCEGSKIIITTRHKLQLNTFDFKVHNVKCLSDDDALELFHRHAFGKGNPFRARIDQSKHIVNRCGNLPLALKILGSSLYDTTDDEWDSTLKRLDEEANPDIQKVLQISYESLQYESDKKLFLLIARFFIGEEKNQVAKILCDFTPAVGIKNLIDRCLITTKSLDNTLDMHQSLQEMAREIVRQESPDKSRKRSILWHDEDSFHVLKKKKGSKKVQGLILDMQKIPEEGDLEFDAFASMINLILVKLKHVHFKGSFTRIPKKLRWICWEKCGLKSIPNDFLPENLVCLHMQDSRLEHVFDGYKHHGTLKFLNLSHSLSLIRTPDFSGLPMLESLILKGCASLVDISESIVNLKLLVLLDVQNCTSLTNIPRLPDSIEKLDMSGCEALRKSTIVAGSDSDCSLRESCKPIFDGYFPSNLQTLSLRGCKLSDHCFPSGFSNLPSLKTLDTGNNLISRLPDCFTNLPALTMLTTDYCRNLQSLVCLSSSSFVLQADYNKSLEIVRAPTNSESTLIGCDKLREIEGCFKLASTENVDKKVLRSLGLGSFMMSEDMKIQVRYEFGIYSTYFIREEVLPSYITMRERGASNPIQLRVPDHHTPHISIVGLNVSFVWTPGRRAGSSKRIEVIVSNMTKNVKWKYMVDLPHCTDGEDCLWVSMWKCDQGLLEVGDDVQAQIMDEFMVTSEWGIKIVYEGDLVDDDSGSSTSELHDQSNPGHSILDKGTTTLPPTRICLTDRMSIEFSDHRTSGSTYNFDSTSSLSFNYNSKRDYQGQLFDWWHELDAKKFTFRCPGYMHGISKSLTRLVGALKTKAV